MPYTPPQPAPHLAEVFVVYASLILVGLLLVSAAYGLLRRRGLVPAWLIPTGDEPAGAVGASVGADLMHRAEPVAAYQTLGGPDLVWLRELVDALHLLVIGHTRGGKTTLIHTLAVVRAAEGQRVIVCDPDAAPGLWPGCEVHGAGDDFAAIGQALADVRREIGLRRRQRGQGRRRSFAPLHLVIDEAQDVLCECAGARALVEDVLRRGGKLGVRLIVGVQDKQVKTLAMEGQGDLRKNFTWVVEVRRAGDGRRWVTLASGDGEPQNYPVPLLPDLDLLAQAHALPVLRQDERPELSGVLHMPGAYRYTNGGRFSPGADRYLSGDTAHTPDTEAVSFEDADAGVSGERITDEVIRMLYSTGWSMNRIARLLTGTQAKRLERIHTAIGDERGG